MSRINWKVVTAVVMIILLIAVSAGLIRWMRAEMGPSETALAALQSDERVTVSQEAGHFTFQPTDGSSSTGLILYPGAGVDPRSYAPVTRLIAANGHLAVIAPMPLNLALLKPNAAERVIAQHPEIEYWVIAGHSLGGVAAASYAADQAAIDGIALLAAYPANDVLADSAIRALSIHGSRDGLISPGDIDESRPLLPSDSLFLEIEGGNHSQFGSYGLQEGDNDASISPEEQWSQIAEAVDALLDSIAE